MTLLPFKKALALTCLGLLLAAVGMTAHTHTGAPQLEQCGARTYQVIFHSGFSTQTPLSFVFIPLFALFSLFLATVSPKTWVCLNRSRSPPKKAFLI